MIKTHSQLLSAIQAVNPELAYGLNPIPEAYIAVLTEKNNAKCISRRFMLNDGSAFAQGILALREIVEEYTGLKITELILKSTVEFILRDNAGEGVPFIAGENVTYNCKSYNGKEKYTLNSNVTIQFFNDESVDVDSHMKTLSARLSQVNRKILAKISELETKRQEIDLEISTYYRLLNKTEND